MSYIKLYANVDRTMPLPGGHHHHGKRRRSPPVAAPAAKVAAAGPPGPAKSIADMGMGSFFSTLNKLVNPIEHTKMLLRGTKRAAGAAAKSAFALSPVGLAYHAFKKPSGSGARLALKPVRGKRRRGRGRVSAAGASGATYEPPQTAAPDGEGGADFEDTQSDDEQGGDDGGDEDEGGGDGGEEDEGLSDLAGLLDADMGSFFSTLNKIVNPVQHFKMLKTAGAGAGKAIGKAGKGVGSALGKAGGVLGKIAGKVGERVLSAYLPQQQQAQGIQHGLSLQKEGLSLTSPIVLGGLGLAGVGTVLLLARKKKGRR
jgi:hypothetical protein